MVWYGAILFSMLSPVVCCSWKHVMHKWLAVLSWWDSQHNSPGDNYISESNIVFLRSHFAAGFQYIKSHFSAFVALSSLFLLFSIYLMTCYGFYANTWVKPVVDLDTFIAAVSENRKKLKQNTASNSLRIDSHVYSKMPSAVLLLLCYFDHRPLGRRFYRGPPSPLIAQCGRRILRGSAEESGRTFPNPGLRSCHVTPEKT